jgi:hypothetical protein
MMATVPGPIAVTRPFEETLATVLSRLNQVTTRPVSTFPPASVRTTEPWLCSPTLSVVLDNVTATADTGFGGAIATKIAALADFPSMVAVIVADPLDTAVTTPDEFTDATVGDWLDQLTARPARTFWLASSACAARVVCPPLLSEADVGVTRTEATAALTTVTVAVALSEPLVALMVVDP